MSAPSCLQTDRLNVRELAAEDWTAIEPLLTDPRVTRFMHVDAWDNPVYRRMWFDQCVTRSDERAGNYDWALIKRDDDAFVGWMVIGDSDRQERDGDRSMGFFVVPSYWSQGFMTEALAAVLQYEFETLGVVRVVGNCEVENVASARVMTKAGLRHVGTIRDADPLEGKVAERHHFAIERDEYFARR